MPLLKRTRYCPRCLPHETLENLSRSICRGRLEYCRSPAGGHERHLLYRPFVSPRCCATDKLCCLCRDGERLGNSTTRDSRDSNSATHISAHNPPTTYRPKDDRRPSQFHVPRLARREEHNLVSLGSRPRPQRLTPTHPPAQSQAHTRMHRPDTGRQRLDGGEHAIPAGFRADQALVLIDREGG